MKLYFTATILFLMALSLSVPAVSAQDVKCSLKLKIKDHSSRKPVGGAAGVAIDKNSGASIRATADTANDDELLFEGLTQAGAYDIKLIRDNYKQTFAEGYSPNCSGTADGVLSVDAFMQKGRASETYLVAAKPKYPDLGVVNGKAIFLARPAYNSFARLSMASGTVVVEVVIDEEGKVISAVAVKGPPALMDISVQAALRSKFKPTLVDGDPIKVSGVIVYNFS